MKKTGILIVLFFLTSQFSFAQEDEKIDSTQIVDLENVVITGQYSAQSVDKSLYQVEVISAEDIKNQAGNTVADVLNQNLNVLIIPNQDSGDSQAEILGLSGAYTKVLVDNIPLVGDTGMGNNIDLTKINLDDVERIEIVKGAMGVDYGSNALAGIINIITKKNIKKDWKINATIQEETVGNEYDWYEDGGVSKGKGRHIQALEIGHKISDNWYVSAGVNRNDFQGFWNQKKGKKYFEQDGLRGYEWQPKEQWNSNGIIRYHKGNFSAFYKLSYLNEEINTYNDVVEEVALGEGNRTYTAIDRDYFTQRWAHHLNLNAKLFNQIRYNGDFSYQTQERKFQEYEYDIPNRRELNRKDENVFLSTKSFYSRGTFSNFTNKQNIDFQVGYELDNIKGFANEFAGELGFSDNVEKKINTAGAFASAEFHFNNGLSLRPGFRANFNNKFDTQFSYSLSSKFNLNGNSNLRAVIGSANRFPNFSELYTYQVDANHTILGDENLNPEDGFSTSIQWNNTSKIDDLKMNNNISTTYINVDDRIELVNLDPTTASFKYLNIDKFKSWGIATAHSFKWKNLNLNLGASILGISKSLYSNDISDNSSIEDEFRYTFEANASANYSIPKWATTFSAYYKYTGKTTEFVQDTELSTAENIVYRLGEREDFSLMDASVRKSFFKNQLEITFGVRNLFDLTSVKNTILAGSGHDEAATTQPLFYGRSYFLKLNYNLEF
jgi:outer membrane receptor for ferrienterochelin and colicins